MGLKTKVKAESSRQELIIEREFDLPLDLLFKAYSEAGLLEKWMGTKVLKLENKKHGSWAFETADANGKVVFRANGVIHEFIPNIRITRTFEMENMPFGVQLEFMEFEKLSDTTSRINIHMIFKTAEQRDQLVKMGMAQGMNMAHNRMEEILSKLKKTL